VASPSATVVADIGPAPVLTDVVFDDETDMFSFNSDQSGTGYLILDSGSTPSKDQMEAGEGVDDEAADSVATPFAVTEGANTGSLDVSAVPSGANNIYAMVKNAEGTRSEVAGVAVTVDNAAPSLSYVRFSSPSYFDGSAEGIPNSWPGGFTLAIKARVQDPLTTEAYLIANSFDTYISVNESGNLEVRAEDTAGNRFINTLSAVTGIVAGDELAILLAGDAAGNSLRVAVNEGAPITLYDDVEALAYDLVLPFAINSISSSGIAQSTIDMGSIWLAIDNLNAVAFWDDFFDGSNNPTAAMLSGAAINSVSPIFEESGDAEAWNARTGMSGTVVDV